MYETIVQIQNEVKKVIVGKDDVVSKVLMAILAQGHVLLEDVPGTGKTTLATAFARALGLDTKRVKPGPGHMASYITPVFICDTCDEDARKALKKCRIYKSFHFSLHGWMDHHTAVVQVSTGQIDANGGGRHTAKILKKILYAKKKKGSM